MDPKDIKDKITEAFKKHMTSPDDRSFDIVPNLTKGKLYEAHVLSLIARDLSLKEGLQLELINSNYIALRSSHGPIDRQYPHIAVSRGGSVVAEIWTDIEFLTLSYSMSAQVTPVSRGYYHELDILVVNPGITGRPTHDDVWLGVESKNTGYGKGLLKEILGVRRELSLLHSPNLPTKFLTWPDTSVPARPPSCLLVYASDIKVLKYTDPGLAFGIKFYHELLKP